MQTNKTILSYSLSPVLTKQGNTCLKGVINGIRAFVPSFSTIEEFEAAVKADNVVIGSITEPAQRKNAKGEDFVSPLTINWVRKAAQPTATEKVLMQSLIEANLTRERTERVDNGLGLVEGVKSALALAREKAALAELKRQEELSLAGGEGVEPSIK